MKATLLALAIALLAPAASAQDQAVECPTTPADTTGWTHYDEDSFAFKLPPRFEEKRAYSIDSQVGRWRSGDAYIYYDFGFYSNKLDPNEQGTFPGLTVCQESGDSGAPRIVVYRNEETGEPTRMGAHWPKLSESAFGETALTIAGSMPSERGFSEMLAVIQSVEFSAEHE